MGKYVHIHGISELICCFTYLTSSSAEFSLVAPLTRLCFNPHARATHALQHSGFWLDSWWRRHGVAFKYCVAKISFLGRTYKVSQSDLPFQMNRKATKRTKKTVWLNTWNTKIEMRCIYRQFSDMCSVSVSSTKWISVWNTSTGKD